MEGIRACMMNVWRDMSFSQLIRLGFVCLTQGLNRSVVVVFFCSGFGCISLIVSFVCVIV